MGELNPAVVEVLAERGISLTEAYPKPLSGDVVRAADVIVTMGCGDACPASATSTGMSQTPPVNQSRWSATSATTCNNESAPCSETSTSNPPVTARRPVNKPSVLFVCVHNAGRSQMAAGYLHHLSNGLIEVRSAGSAPGAAINPVAVQAMAEEGIDISANAPKVLTTEAVQDSDVVITMGCGDACPIFPGKRYEDWELDDPAGQGLEAVRPIRDEIRHRVKALITELIPASAPEPDRR